MDSAQIRTRLSAGVSAHYEIEREIGAGGMATVYLARDIRHDRRVAFKVLSPELGAVLGVDRFLSEIRVTANLQHPNLLPLFDSGEADGLLYYVMPFVDGESLRARLDRERQLPVDEAIRITLLIAGALEYAHGEGVIHRDLKPENILLSRGQPLIADFGIALAVSLAGGARVTQTGLSLGTPQYMSPEQATGDRQIDARTDVYSLAAVLYEMLTGDPPHNASTVQGIIAKVLTERPTSVRVGRPNVSEQVDYAILHALEKLPADRISSAREFALSLEGKALAQPSAYAIAARRAATAPMITPRWRDRLREPLTLALLAATVVSSAAALWKWNGDASPDEGPTIRFILQIPHGNTSNGAMLAVSPDGSNYVHRTFGTADTLLYLRPSGSMRAIPIPGSGGANRPVFSPDGKWIAYQARGELKKVSLDGFRTVKVADLQRGQLGAWVNDDTFLLAGMPGLSTLSASGGVPVTLTVPDTAKGESAHSSPRVAPNGETVFFGVVDRQTLALTIGVVSLKTGKRTLLAVEGSPLGVIDDNLIYSTSAGSLFAVPFDFGTGAVRGNSIIVADSIRISGGRGALFQGRAGIAALSRSGTLIYLSGDSTRPRDVVAVDTSGGKRVLIAAAAPGLSDPRFSPNGRRIAFSAATDSSSEVWVYDLVSRTMDRLAREREGRSFRPEWTPDEKRILFNRTVNAKEELWWQLADGSAPAELLQAAATDVPQGFVSRDGQWLIYQVGSPSARAGRLLSEGSAPPGRGGRRGGGQRVRTDTDLWYRRLSGDTTSKPLSTGGGYVEMAPALSPDGRWLAYNSNETGTNQVYVRPFPGPGARKLVSIDGGSEAIWSRDGRTLFYRVGPTIAAATIVTVPEFAATNRRTLFTEPPWPGSANHRQYDLSPDGKSFLMISTAVDEQPALVVVHNWAAELRARLTSGGSGKQ